MPVFRKVASDAAREAAKAATEAAMAEIWQSLNNERSSFSVAVKGLQREMAEARVSSSKAITTAVKDLKTAVDGISALLRSGKEDREVVTSCVKEFQSLLKDLNEREVNCDFKCSVLGVVTSNVVTFQFQGLRYEYRRMKNN